MSGIAVHVTPSCEYAGTASAGTFANTSSIGAENDVTAAPAAFLIDSSTALLPTASVVLPRPVAGTTETVTGAENVPAGHVTFVPPSLVTVPELAGPAAVVEGVASAAVVVVVEEVVV